MLQSLRTVKSRIRSVQSIKKMTQAMEMVSSAKLRSLEKELFALRRYYQQIERLLNNLLASATEARNPLLQPRPNKQNILLCLITSDTGLCGNYNSAIIHKAEEFIRSNSNRNISLLSVGKKGLNRFKKNGIAIAGAYTDLYGHYSGETADKIAKDIMVLFVSGKIDEAYVCYTNFVSVSRNKPVVEKFLNLERGNGEEIEYLTEPDMGQIIDEIIPLYLTSKIRNFLLGSFTAEQSIRVMAMHEATDNAGELLDGLVLQRNKMRQALITGELIEVVSAADAMKG